MSQVVCSLWSDDRGEDIAEYALMLAVLLTVVILTLQAIGNNASNIFTQAGQVLVPQN